MEILVERCAGLDVHRDTVVACVRAPDGRGGRAQEVVTFGATSRELRALRDWLASRQVTRVGMESTGVYWRCVYYELEDGFDCWVFNAARLRRVPGRKTDVSDAEWLCRITEHGLVQPSFVPPKPLRELRALTRYRRAQIEERTREVQRLDKVLQDAGVKLSSVASDILGRSGRDMLAALVAGTRDPEVLADLARGVLRKKLPALAEALEGRFSVHHAALVAHMLATIDQADEMIGALSAQVSSAAQPYQHHIELLSTIPAVKQRTAEAIVAEIGVDMVRFGSSQRLASWAGMCPGNNESGGKRRTARKRKGSPWLTLHLTEAAAAAGRSDIYLGAHYRRLRSRRGPAKATKALGHTILVAAYHMLLNDTAFVDLGADWFDKRRPEAHVRRLVRQLNALGYRVELSPIQAA